MKKLLDTTAYIFITAVAVLSIVAVLGVWDYFSKDVITKSFETLGLLAFVAIIVIIAGHFIENRSQTDPTAIALPNPIFKGIRRITLAVLIIAVTILAILGVLAIWDIIANKDILYKSVGSVTILAFAALIMVMTALEREDNPLFKRNGKSLSVGSVIVIIIFVYLLLSFGRFFW